MKPEDWGCYYGALAALAIYALGALIGTYW